MALKQIFTKHYLNKEDISILYVLGRDVIIKRFRLVLPVGN